MANQRGWISKGQAKRHAKKTGKGLAKLPAAGPKALKKPRTKPDSKPSVPRGKAASGARSTAGREARKAPAKGSPPPKTKSKIRPRAVAAPVLPTASDQADTVRPLALEAIAAALDKKAEQPTLLDVRQLSSYADYVLLLSADSERQVEAIGRAIAERLRQRGTRLRGSEAAGEFNWLLMDFGDLVIHIFFRDARGFYDLEGLWADAPRVQLRPATAAAR